MNSGIEIDTVAVNPLSSEERADLEESLKRCSEETRNAVFEFRETGRVSLLPGIVIGLIERFLEPEVRTKLRSSDDSIRLVDDLRIDSLTMMEIVVLVEEALDISIDNQELRDLRTLDDVSCFIDAKTKGLPLPQRGRLFGIEAIGAAVPHRPPFLFLNEARVENDTAVGAYTITGEEDFLGGHFPGNPIMPASIMLEALGQLAVFHLVTTQKNGMGSVVDSSKVLFTSVEAVRCQRICLPGETLTLRVKLKHIRHPLAMFEGKITVNGESAAWAEEICLTFDWVGVAGAR